MGLKIIWSKQAAKGYAQLLGYLDENWTVREVKNFESQVSSFLNHLQEHPYLLKRSEKKGLRRGPINKYTLVTYQVDIQKKEIRLVNMRSTKLNPVVEKSV